MDTIRVLIVDDSERWRSFVRSMLERTSGFLVLAEASDGIEAIDKAATLLPDVVLLDIGMPRLHGIAAATEIRRAHPESKIIFLTQENDGEIKKAAFAAGAVAYVLKSRVGCELRTTIETAMLPMLQAAGARLSGPENSPPPQF